MRMANRGTRKELDYVEAATPTTTRRDDQNAALLQTVERTEATARAEATTKATARPPMCEFDSCTRFEFERS